MIVSPATALATAVPIDRQGVAPPHVGPSVPVLETWSVMDRAVAGIASAIARTATAGRRDCLIKVLARNMFRAPLGSLSCGRASLATGRWPGDGGRRRNVRYLHGTCATFEVAGRYLDDRSLDRPRRGRRHCNSWRRAMIRCSHAPCDLKACPVRPGPVSEAAPRGFGKRLDRGMVASSRRVE